MTINSSPGRIRAFFLAITRVEVALLAASLGGLAAFLAEGALSNLFFGRLPLAFDYLELYLSVSVLPGWLAGLAAGLFLLVRDREERGAGLPQLLAAAPAAFSAAFVVTNLWVLAGLLSSLPLRISSFFGRRPPDPSTVGAILFFAVVASWLVGVFVLNRVSGLRLSFLSFLLSAMMVPVTAWRAHAGASGDQALLLIAGIWLALIPLAAWLRGRPRFLAVCSAGGMGVALVLFLSFRGPTKASAPADPSSPNLLLIVIDTLRHDVFRSVVAQTPEGARFRAAMDGAAWFDGAVATAPWTVPSMGSIMTGLYPEEHGLVSSSQASEGLIHPLSRRLETLAERLSGRGYRCEALVSNPILRGGRSGIDRGFDRYWLLTGPPSRLPLLIALGRFGEVVPDYYLSGDVVVWRFRRQASALVANQPFFLWLHLMDPHGPLKPHPELEALAPPGSSRGGRDGYRLEVRFALLQAARVLENLHGSGALEQTAVVVVSDHGEMKAEDGRSGRSLLRSLGHGHALYDELLRVPLVIRPPGGLAADRHVDAVVSHVDLHDTILDLLGVEEPRIGRDRQSLTRWLEESPPDPQSVGRTWAYSGSVQLGEPQHALQLGRHKLILYDDERRPELYDLSSDPRERRDLASMEPEQVDRLRRYLSTLKQQLVAAEESAPVELDEDSRRQLEALGYLGGR